MALLLYIFLFAAALSSCSQLEPDTIRVVDWYDSTQAKIRSESFRLRSNSALYHGPLRFYDTSGQLTSLEYYSMGNLHGPSVFFWPNGLVKEEATLKDGRLMGIFREYYITGRIRQVREFENSRLVRIISVLGPHGDRLDPGSFTDGNGHVKLYGLEGELAMEGEYRKGRREGAWILYSSSGHPWRTIEYVDGSVIQEDGKPGEFIP